MKKFLTIAGVTTVLSALAAVGYVYLTGKGEEASAETTDAEAESTDSTAE